MENKLIYYVGQNKYIQVGNKAHNLQKTLYKSLCNYYNKNIVGCFTDIIKNQDFIKMIGEQKTSKNNLLRSCVLFPARELLKYNRPKNENEIEFIKTTLNKNNLYGYNILENDEYFFKKTLKKMTEKDFDLQADFIIIDIIELSFLIKDSCDKIVNYIADLSKILDDNDYNTLAHSLIYSKNSRVAIYAEKILKNSLSYCGYESNYLLEILIEKCSNFKYSYFENESKNRQIKNFLK